jgi:hypothetical protein
MFSDTTRNPVLYRRLCIFCGMGPNQTKVVQTASIVSNAHKIRRGAASVENAAELPTEIV